MNQRGADQCEEGGLEVFRSVFAVATIIIDRASRNSPSPKNSQRNVYVVLSITSFVVTVNKYRDDFIFYIMGTSASASSPRGRPDIATDRRKYDRTDPAATRPRRRSRPRCSGRTSCGDGRRGPAEVVEGRKRPRLSGDFRVRSHHSEPPFRLFAIRRVNIHPDPGDP